MPLSEAKQRLKEGDVVAIPTETVYGLAADIENEKGIKRVFEVKERPFFDPLIVHVDSIEKAKSLTTDWTEIHAALALKCWPGPLTLIAPKIHTLNPLITSGLTDVGLRCPRHQLTLELLKDFHGLAAPSANKFGKTSPTSAEHVRAEFGDSVLILDGGPCDVGIESTVAAVTRAGSRWKLVVYRPGFYTAATLHDILEDQGLPTETGYAESPVAPGQLEHHYMPSIPVIVGEKIPQEEVIESSQKKLKKTFSKIAHLELGNDPVLEARMFYQQLRDLSPGHDAILVMVNEKQRKDENWRALMNRLYKAASFRA
ncbi:MAG: threonylcarbamoyl-AMP synthase [Bacteriovoracaceae bacterium]|nr:threonylcarbamoyl-AMP synthase [Bacteriovoracaceae bacterium]